MTEWKVSSRLDTPVISDMPDNSGLITRQLLVKIPNYPCLYRHKDSKMYYGIKKLRGKRKEHSPSEN